MARRRAKTAISADITYHDYLMLLCSMDAEWTQRRRPQGGGGRIPSVMNHQQFAMTCYDFARGIVQNCRGLQKANGKTKFERLDESLFNPVSYFALGHEDDLVFVLLDDFDAARHLTARTSRKLEDVSLGFCPQLSSLRLRGDTSMFCEPHELPDRKRNRCNGRGTSRTREVVGRQAPAMHAFQSKAPLLVFTKYKMHGLGATGQGLLFQQSLFRVMAEKVQSTIHLLKTTPLEPMIEDDDARTTRCCFLDMQGLEEIATLIFTRNYSVAAALVAAVRSLTFDDVFKTDPRVRELLEASPAHLAVIRAATGRRMYGKGAIGKIRNSHVFRWTHSVLSVARDPFFGRSYRNCHGYIEAMSDIQLAPGHRGRASEKAFVAGARAERRLLPEPQAKAGYRSLVFGANDMMLFHGLSAGGRSGSERKRTGSRLGCDSFLPGSHLPTIHVADLLRTVRKNLLSFGVRPADSSRDVIDIRSVVLVPVPRILSRRPLEDLLCPRVKRQGHYAALSSLLPELSDRLCCPHNVSRPTRDESSDGGRLSIQELVGMFREAGIPLSLRRRIAHLYQNYATVLADTFSFDAVLDLYDAFATLHAVVSEHLPKLRRKGRSAVPANMPPLDDDRARQLAGLARAMQNALDHRMSKAYPDVSYRDMAIDYRGGLNQILLAADAPMKCGLGMVRLYTGEVDPRRRRRDRVGGLACISPITGAEAYSLVLGTENQAQLAFFDIDVPHVTHVASYYDFLHEAGHVMFGVLAQKHPNDKLFSMKDADPYVYESLSEVFATLLGQVIVFGGDTDVPMYNTVAAYSRSLKSVGVDECDTVTRFTEVLINCFLASDRISQAVTTSPDVADVLAGNWEDGGLKAARKRFAAMVRRVGPFFVDYERLWAANEEGPAWQYTRRQFDNAYSRLRPYMPRVWGHIGKVYAYYREEEVLPHYGEGALGGCADLPTLAQLIDEIDRGLEEGRPFIRSLCQTRSRSKVAPRRRRRPPDEPPDPAVNRLFLIAICLQRYIRTVRKAKGKKVHLLRDENGRIDYAASGKQYRDGRKWFTFQCNRGYTAMFCPVPSGRRARLRKHITILKTFWDISSNLRARRLWRVVTDNFRDVAE